MMTIVCRCCGKSKLLSRGVPTPRRLDDFTCEACVAIEGARVRAILEGAKARAAQKLDTLEDEIWAEAWAH